MPFVLRQVQPIALSRGRATDARVSELDPRQLISNVTLAACLRQLASLVVTAHDMFGEYERQAQQIYERSRTLKARLGRLQTLVDGYDSRAVPVRKWRPPPLASLTSFPLIHLHTRLISIHGQIRFQWAGLLPLSMFLGSFSVFFHAVWLSGPQHFCCFCWFIFVVPCIRAPGRDRFR